MGSRVGPGVAGAPGHHPFLPVASVHMPQSQARLSFPVYSRSGEGRNQPSSPLHLTGPGLAALLQSGAWGKVPQCSLQPVMVVRVQESRVESVVALGAAAGPRWSRCAVLCCVLCWPGGPCGRGSPAGALGQAQGPRMPQKWGIDSHGGMFDHPKSTSCKQDKGRLLKFVPFRRKDATLLRSTALAKKKGGAGGAQFFAWV